MLDNWDSLKARGPRTVAPTFIANALTDSCSGMIAIETGAIGHNMCVVSACATGHPQRRRGRRGDPPRRLHRGHQRLDRGPAPRGRSCRLLEHARDGHAAPRRGTPDGVAPVRRDARRLRPRRGRGLAVPRGSRAGQGARRADLRRGRGLRVGGRRLGHDPADRRRRRVRPGDADGPRAPRRPGRRGRPDQPARDVDAARRQARGRGHLDRLRDRARRVLRARSRSAPRSR